MAKYNDKPSFVEQLHSRPLVTDGSMATELARRGHFDTPPALYNLKNPVLVESIHREFLDAGAQIIQTNTEHANRIALEPVNLADKVYELNRKGVWIARCAALHKAWVAGVVGPTGTFLHPLGKTAQEEARRAFIDQIVALVDGGADLLMLKSFIDVEELEAAIDAAQFVSSDIPIVAYKTFPEDAAVLATSFPTDIRDRLLKKGVALIGSNGTVGPQRMLGIVNSLTAEGVTVASQPDIGIPTLIDGKANYNAEPEYVARTMRRIVAAGAALIGADGGATVEHIRAIAEAVRDVEVGCERPEPRKPRVIKVDNGHAPEESAFYRNLGKKFLTTVELDIPRGLDMSSVLEGARYLKEKGIDAVDITDGARARLRMSSIAISKLVQDEVGMECITHLACRDRNMIGLQSELLGAYAMGVRNILAVTGDPAQVGDYPYSTSVYDVDSIGLIRALHRMNHGEDLMGNTLGRRTHFMIACACNPVADDLDREVRRLEQKAAQGAMLAFTQPVFEIATLEAFLERIRHIDIQLMLGVIPLRSARHAEFLHYEVPGITIPDWVHKRISATGSLDEATDEGIALAVEFLREAKSMVAGVYLMPPFKKYWMAVQILEQI